MSDGDQSCLLMQLFGPMQSWGTDSQWRERESYAEPSKSGVIGILAAALGRSRRDSVGDLAVLRMGVRVDLEGEMVLDYQTVGAGYSVLKSSADAPSVDKQWKVFFELAPSRLSRKESNALITPRRYLQDAAFLVALQSDDKDFLHRLDCALRGPVFPIGLGRRSYVPSIPIAMPRDEGVVDGCIEQVLRRVLWLPEQVQLNQTNLFARKRLHLRTVVEVEKNAHATRMDQPIGAAFATRQFGPRGVVFDRIPVIHKQKGGNQ